MQSSPFDVPSYITNVRNDQNINSKSPSYAKSFFFNVTTSQMIRNYRPMEEKKCGESR